MERKLLFLDLDGTLLNDAKKITVKSKGIRAAVRTGAWCHHHHRTPAAKRVKASPSIGT